MSEPPPPPQHENPDLLQLGRAICLFRVEAGLDVRHLAQAALVPEDDIAQLEAGRLDPTYELLIALAQALHVRPSAFVTRAEALEGRADPPASSR